MKCVREFLKAALCVAIVGWLLFATAFAEFPVNGTGLGNPKPTSVNASDQSEMRRQFINEFGKYRQSVFNLMQIHDPKLRVGNTSYGPPVTKEAWVQTMRELSEIDSACKTKYAGMTNDPSRVAWGDLNQLPATWCEIAARRAEYEEKGKAAAVKQKVRFILEQIDRDILTVEREPEERIGLPIQELFWETEKWKSAMFEKLKPRFTEFDATIPDDFLNEYIDRAAVLREKRVASGGQRSFTQPPNRDTVIENWVRQQYAKSLPGVQVLKIGSEYSDWRVFTNRVNIPTSRTKRGWSLLKIPGRPLCQAREWIVKQDYAGGGRYTATKVDSLGFTGILTKCG